MNDSQENLKNVFLLPIVSGKDTKICLQQGLIIFQFNFHYSQLQLKSIHKHFAAITDSFIISRIFAQSCYFSRHYNGFDVYFMVNTIKF